MMVQVEIEKQMTELKNKKITADRAWTREEDSMLGSASDEEVANKLMRFCRHVRVRRQELKIPKFRDTRWTAEVVAAIGVMTDTEVVKRFGLTVTPSAVTTRRLSMGIRSVVSIRDKVMWRPEWVAMLGEVPDHEIAAIIGIHKDTVAAKRRMIGKAKFTQR